MTVHMKFKYGKISLVIEVSVAVMLGEIILGRGTERSLWGADYVLKLDLGGDYMKVFTLF